MSFPYRQLFEKKSPSEILAKISLEGSLGQQRLIREVKSKRPFPDQLISSHSIYQEGSYLSDLFTEEARIKTRVWDEKNKSYFPSPYEYWESEKEKLANLSLEKQRDLIYLNSCEATQFNVFAATRIYNLVAQLLKREISVFDPFAGWGDRALAALATDGVKSYIGVDCNPSLFPGYKKLQTFDQNKKLSFIQSSIEEVKLNQQFDLILTSPPFFKFEEYETTSGKQSTVLYPCYKDWLHFMERLLLQLGENLIKDGFLMFHFGDTSAAPTLCQDLQNLFKEVGWHFLQRIDLITENSNNQLKRSVPIWVYRF